MIPIFQWRPNVVTSDGEPAAVNTAYCTLAELKHRLQEAYIYTASTISFTASTKKIADSAKGLARFQTSRRIQVSGSDSNDGYYNIATGSVAAEIVTTESLVNESVGAEITISDVTDPTDDTALEGVIEAVSRAIDLKCERFFYQTAAETRYYSAPYRGFLLTDDIVSVTSLATDLDGDRTYETTWAATDFDLEPYNAALEGKPYNRISVAPNGTKTFSTVRRGNALLCVYGWPAVPDPIREACILQSMRLFKRKDSIYGVVGSAEMGQMLVISKLDPDVDLLLRPYRRGASLI